MSDVAVHNITSTFVSLDSGHGARPVAVTDDFWEALAAGRLDPIHRLVSFASFDRDWRNWERHPEGEELVLLLEGHVILRLDLDEGEDEVELCEEGQFVLVPANTWHTAQVRQPSRMLFITPGGEGEHRPA